MRKLLFFVFLLISSSHCMAQGYYPYQEIKLEKPSDYKDAEPLALSAATFILSTPFKKDDPERSHAITFLIDWMSGSKQLHFSLQDAAQAIMEDKDLFELYNAAMAKFTLENKTVATTNQRLVRAAAYKLVLGYCDNPVNNFKLKKKVRRQLEND